MILKNNELKCIMQIVKNNVHDLKTYNDYLSQFDENEQNEIFYEFCEYLKNDIDNMLNELKTTFEYHKNNETKIDDFETLQLIDFNFNEIYDCLNNTNCIFIKISIHYVNAYNVACCENMFCTFDVDDMTYCDNDYCMSTFANMFLLNNNMM